MRRYIISALGYVVIGIVVAGYIITSVKIDALREDTRQLREEAAAIQAEREDLLERVGYTIVPAGFQNITALNLHENIIEPFNY